MKFHRFFIKSENIKNNEIIIQDENLIKQLIKVLRFEIGGKIVFLDNSGDEYLSKIVGISKEYIIAAIEKKQKNLNEPNIKISLYQALCKKDKFEWVLQKGVEIGISEFIPIITERTEKLGLDFERCRKILKESAEQSERGIIPKISDAQNFNDAIKDVDGEKLLLDKSGENIKSYILQPEADPPASTRFGEAGPLAENPKSYTLTANRYTISLFVGPEGGWTENELQIAKESGVKIISLGPRVLRTETAGIIASSFLLLR